MGPVSLLP